MDTSVNEPGLNNFYEVVMKRLICLGHVPGNLEHFRIMTVKDLLSKEASTSHLLEKNFLSLQSSGKQSSLPQEVKTIPLGHETHQGSFRSASSVVLVGQLIPAIEIISDEYHRLPSELLFCDSTGQLPCFVTNISLSQVGKTLIICQWNFIKSPQGPGYLELVEMVELDGKSQSSNLDNCLKVYVPRDGRFLQTNRSVIGSGLINVIGQVSAVSHLMRLKKVIVFLVQFTDTETHEQLIILNRDLKKLYWNLLIRPQKEYIFTNLKPTTLYPNDEKSTDVLLVTNDSQLYLASEVNDRIEVINILDFLSAQGFDKELYASWRRDKTDESTIHPINFGIVNFKGTVSKTSLSDVGIVELDDNMRLHLTNILKVQNSCHLRIGTQVTLFNVHILKSKKTSYRNIFCCNLGCVRIEKFSNQLKEACYGNSNKDVDPEARHLLPLVMRIMQDRNLTFVDFDCVLEAAMTFQRQFSPKLIPHPDVNLFYDIVAHGRPECAPPIQKKVRSAIMEFASNDHNRGCGISSKSVKHTAFHIATIREISGIFNNRMVKVINKLETGENGWGYQIISSEDLAPKWVITAVLRCSQSSARLQLVDLTGSIDCIVASASCVSRPPDNVHQCMDGKCFTKQEFCFPTVHICPFAQTWSIGCLYRINSYHIIREVFQKQEGTSTDCETTLVRMYVQFSLTDALCLRQFDVIHPSSKWMRNSSQMCQQERKRRKLSSVAVTTGLVDNVNNQLDPGLNNLCDSLPEEIDSKLHTEANHCSCFVSQKFVARHKESIQACCNLPNIVALSFYVDAFLIGENFSFNCGCKPFTVSDKQLAQPSSSSGKNVSLLFQDKAVCWYPFIHRGCIYCVTVYGTTDRKKFDRNAALPAFKRFATKQVIMLNTNIHLDRVFPLTTGNIQSEAVVSKGFSSRLNITELELATVQKVLEDMQHRNGNISEAISKSSSSIASGEGHTFTTCKGVIISRGLKEQHGGMKNMLPTRSISTLAALYRCGVAIPENLNILLIVRDLISLNEFSIYINPSRIQYPFGLFVGAVVHLERLEGCISKSNRPYFQFLSTSSCTVLQLASHEIERTSLSWCPYNVPSSALGPIPSVRNPLSYVYLQDMWSKFSSFDSAYIMCQINKIKRVILEFSCACHECIAVEASGNCVRCQEQTRFRAVASFSVDDGTGVAFVSCQGDQVANLLMLDSAQWDYLKSLVRKTAGIKYIAQQNGNNFNTDVASTAALLIHLLSESCIVRRRVVLEARKFRMFHNSAGMRFSDIKLLGLADFDKKVKKLKDYPLVQLETLQLPFLQLEYVSMQEINYGDLVTAQYFTS